MGGRALSLLLTATPLARARRPDKTDQLPSTTCMSQPPTTSFASFLLTAHDHPISSRHGISSSDDSHLSTSPRCSRTKEIRIRGAFKGGFSNVDGHSLPMDKSICKLLHCNQLQGSSLLGARQRCGRCQGLFCGSFSVAVPARSVRKTE